MQVQRQTLEQRWEAEGFGASIFPEVSNFLRRKPEVFWHLISNKTSDRYKSLVDCWFSEVMGEYEQRLCFAYYKHNQKHVRKLITKRKAEQIQRYLLFTLGLAEVLHQNKVKMGWKQFRLLLQMAKTPPTIW
jgi:hypothetical protein